jgi:cell shape-determining protein MreC
MSDTDFVNTFLAKQREYMHDFMSRLIMAETNIELITKTNEALTQENQNLKATLDESFSGQNTELDRLYAENNQLRELYQASLIPVDELDSTPKAKRIPK